VWLFDKVKKPFFKEEEMKKLMVAMMVLAVAMVLAASCGDTETVVKGAQKVEVQGTVHVQMCASDCVTNDDCGDYELCVIDKDSSKACGHEISNCRQKCTGEMETVENEDGTSFTDWVEGTDTCQRFGDTSLYCDLVSGKCKEYTPAEEPTDVVEPEPVEPEPVDEPKGDKEIECCYPAGDFTGLYGGFGWSESTLVDPEACNGTRNREIDENGCFRATVNMGNVFGGVLYSGLHKGLYTTDEAANKAIPWVEDKFGQPTCTIGAVSAKVDPHFQGKGYPFYQE